MEWGRTPGEAGHCEIEAAPEEMDGAHLANIGGAKSVKHAIDRDDRMEETPYRVGIIGPRSPIISKRNRIWNFIRTTVELWRAAKFPDEVQEARVKLRNGHWAKRESCSVPIGCSANNSMVEKIEGDLRTARAVRDYRSR
jgi:hypothetical protein